MINLEKFQAILTQYKKDFVPKVWNDEKYKWEAVKHFQDNWDIDAPDFLNMFLQSTSRTQNLLASLNHYPREMIKVFAEKEAETVRSMFLNLFDETKDLAERVENFLSTSDVLLKKYSKGKSHFQSTYSVSTYLWLRYPDKYYIYKFSECRSAAIALESDFVPKMSKKGHSIDNLLKSFNLYDEICSELAKDKELVQILRSVLTDSCYPDIELKTLTIDFCFYIGRLYAKKSVKENEWFPIEYNPNISTEKWLELLADKNVFNENSLAIMKRIKDYGGEATCKQLAAKYGETANFYNSGSSALAQRVAKVTGCPVIKDEAGNTRWWPILYIGKYADKNIEGSFVWKLREELSRALDQYDLSHIPLYSSSNSNNHKITYKEYINFFDQKFNSKQYSYMMVTLLAFLDNVNNTGYADMGNVVESFKQFYLNRVKAGKIPEKQTARMFKVESLNNSDIKNIMLEQPLSALRDLIDYDEHTNTLHFNKKRGLEIDWKTKKELRKVAHKHLYNYYKKLDKNYLTLDDLNSLQQGYAVTAKDVAALSGQNIVKGIHPINDDAHKSVVILCTFSGGFYANSWLDEHETVLKYYLEGRTKEDGTRIYNELSKSNQAVLLSQKEEYPIHVFTRDKKDEMFHYEGPYVYDRIETESDGSKYFVLTRLINRAGQEIIPDSGSQIQEKAKEIIKDLTVPDVLTHICEYIAARGFVFEEKQIKNFYLSLKTKPFVIIAGISGTGKSKLVQLVANAVGATAENERYTLVPVRPDWNDSTDLLGYENLQGEFNPGPLIKVINRAINNPDLPYFVCLDEMNLSRVEYYFSDFLSIIESRTLQNGVLSSAPIQINGKKALYFPGNLYIIGTVNMDETTHSFSRKVLDRANTIELTEVNLSILPQIREDQKPLVLSNDYFKSEYVLLKDCLAGEEDFIKEKIKILEEINKLIEPGGFQVGYRVRDEFCFYLLYNKRWELLPEEQAIDFQIMQKILPRIQGSAHELEKILEDLKKYCEDSYPVSYKKADFMLRRLLNDGFTSFWP